MTRNACKEKKEGKEKIKKSVEIHELAYVLLWSESSYKMVFCDKTSIPSSSAFQRHTRVVSQIYAQEPLRRLNVQYDYYYSLPSHWSCLPIKHIFTNHELYITKIDWNLPIPTFFIYQALFVMQVWMKPSHQTPPLRLREELRAIPYLPHVSCCTPKLYVHP